MTFVAEDFREWFNILYKHPEWREELRRATLTDDILELPRIVRELSESVRELSSAHQAGERRLASLEIAMEELAAAQRELAVAQQELAAAQQRTEQRVEELAAAQQRTEQRVGKLASELGGLQRSFGATLEEEAASVVEEVFKEKGYRILERPFPLAIGQEGEVDVVLPVESPDGKKAWVVVESRARLSRGGVESWSKRMKSEGWRKRLAKHGVVGPYIVYAYSIRLDRGAEALAKEEGVGLLQDKGEILPPGEWIATASN